MKSIKAIFNWYLIILGSFTVFSYLAFFRLASELSESQLFSFDKLISQWIFAFRTDLHTKIMIFITNLGSSVCLTVLVLLITILGLWFRKGFIVISFNIVAIGAQSLTEWWKRVFLRPRPSEPWLTTASGYSFPSGHALVSLAIYGILAYLVFRTIKCPFIKYVLVIGLLLIPILIGISRIYLGVHYPSDVLAGWALAMGWGGTCVIGIEYFERLRLK